ncbi:transposase [Usitatibacter palustris]|uniref:Transposase IS200-like domain-containing protein n=1 Tax=Usitatibacter palustris TaxID=2732487 RepID=A0A6M4H963_9PROT|nr:transposase [Usitatibacter palustris]QJR15812.1 hypothetical protein DSM104440_02638 [Usitatibacter palustris]
MPRTARPVASGIPLHIVHRGHNRVACFRAPDEYSAYLALLGKAASLSQCRVHAYVLMTNHVHLLVTPSDAGSAAALMKTVAQRFAQASNARYKRTGALWEGRFYSGLVLRDSQFLACHRYIELNPVRAGMVGHPAAYEWSSYRINAEGQQSSLVEPHETYLRLAHDPAERLTAYRELFSTELSPADLEAIRRGPRGPRGRPKKGTVPISEKGTVPFI